MSIKTPLEVSRAVEQGRKCLADLHEFWKLLAPTIRIMVVDDEKTFCDYLMEVLKHIFAGRKYELMTAFSGEQALALMENQKVDLLFLDLRMPKAQGDGVSVLERMDKNQTVVLIVTGIEGESPEIIRARELGYVNIISKTDLYSDLCIIFGKGERQCHGC